MAASPRRLRLEIFSAASDERSRRHAADVVRLLAAAVLVALLTAHADDPTRFEQRLVSLIDSVPSAGDSWWRAPLDVALLYACVLFAVCLVARRRYRLVIELLAAGVGAWAIGIGLGALAEGSPPDLFDASPAGSDPSYPVLRLAVIAAVLATARPHLSRTFRRLGHLFVGVATVSALLLTHPSGCSPTAPSFSCRLCSSWVPSARSERRSDVPVAKR